MKFVRTTATAVEKFKQQAKSRAKDSGSPLASALDAIAQENGFSHWKHVTECAAATAANPLRSSDEKGRTPAPVARVPTWPIGPAAINAIPMPPDHRAMLVPQLKLLEIPGRVYWRLSNGDDLERSSDGFLASLEEALQSVGAVAAKLKWVDITYEGVVMGACHGWELTTSAADIAADLRRGAAGIRAAGSA